MIQPNDVPLVEQWAEFFTRWSSVSFLQAYFTATAETSFFPKSSQGLQVLLNFFLLEDAIYEINMALQSNPDQMLLPLCRIADLLGYATEPAL